MTEDQDFENDWSGVAMRPGDENLPGAVDRWNLVMNRRRLQEFVGQFAGDADVRDFLLLDGLAELAGLELSSTGLTDPDRGIALRPFRIWEYVWIFKALGLREGGLNVLDLGGPISHLTFLAAIAGNQVLSLDIDERAIQANRRSAELLALANLQAGIGDMRNISSVPDASVDCVMSCSVLEHLTGADQSAAMREMARVLKPGGRIGLTFDYGPDAAGVNIHLPPPHDPPRDAATALARLLQPGLAVLGNQNLEEPIPGSLFHDKAAEYTMASLFLEKGSGKAIAPPAALQGPSVLGKLAASALPDAAVRAASARRVARERHQSNWDQSNTQLAIMRQAAEERLVLLERSTEEANQLRLALNHTRDGAGKRLAIIQEMDLALKERELLRSEAEKRLQVIEELRQELDRIKNSAQKNLSTS